MTRKDPAPRDAGRRAADVPAPTCPICGKPAAPRPGNRSAPFCSDRCRLLDLGNWLGEAYRVPGERAGDGAPQLARDPAGDDEEDPT